MEIDEAKKVIIETYDEYYLARQKFLKGKGADKKLSEHKMDILKLRVKSIFYQCPELYDYVMDDFFEYPHFWSDYPELIDKLNQIETLN